MTHRASLLLPLLVFPFLAGCTGCGDIQLGDSTPGAEGALTFTESGLGEGCLFGCAVDRPLLTGSTMTVEITGDVLDQGFTVESADPFVLTASAEASACCDDGDGKCVIGFDEPCSGKLGQAYTAALFAAAPGATTLQVRDAAGTVVDHIDVEVTDAAAITFSCSDNDTGADLGDEIRLATSCTYTATAIDAEGRTLAAHDGFDITIVDPRVATVVGDWLASAGDASTANHASSYVGTLTAQGSGQTSVLVRAPGASLSVALRVP
jgi:hypothetical protein